MNKIDFSKYWSRLKNPAVVVGLLGYILTILASFGLEVDNQAMQTVIQSVSGILILLGILNNPDEAGMDLPVLTKKLNNDDTTHDTNNSNS